MRVRGCLAFVLLLLVSSTACLQMMVRVGDVVAPHTAQGYRLAESDQCDQAVRELQSALREQEAPLFDGLRHYGIAGCMFVVGDLAGAERESNLLTQDYPDLAWAGYMFLAWIRYARNDLDGAVAATDEAVRVARDENSRTQARAAQVQFHVIRDGHALDAAMRFRDCHQAESIARAIVQQHPAGDIDIVPAGNRAAHVRRGGVAELAGIVAGDRILSIDGSAVSTTTELGEAMLKLGPRYGETVPVEILRKGVPGDDPSASTIERKLTIQVKLEYPEMNRARAFLLELSRDRDKVCASSAGDSQDRIPPQLIVIEPKSRDLLVRPVAAGRSKVHFVVLASDNIRLASVEIDGLAAVAGVPSDLEKTFLPGDVHKFAVDIQPGARDRTVAIRAADSSGNQTVATVNLQVGKVTAPAPEGRLFASSVALVVGIDGYAEAPPLEFAVRDAQSVAAKLRGFGFERVTELYDGDATRAQILRVLADELPGVLTPDDRFVFYFAGHGQTDAIRDGSQHEEGYLIPFDGSIRDFRGTGISMTKIHDVIHHVRANHMLFIFDSCYSGLGFKRALPSQVPTGFIRKLASQRAVEMITAGGKNEQAAEADGHGLFTKHLLTALDGDADSDHDGYLLGSEIGAYVRREVSDASHNQQTPLYGWVAGEGDFLLELGR